MSSKIGKIGGDELRTPTDVTHVEMVSESF